MSTPVSYFPGLEKLKELHAAPVLSLRVSDNYVVTGSADAFVRVWFKSSGDIALPALYSDPKASFKTVEISEELGLVFGGDGKGNITAWRLSDGERMFVQEAHEDTVLSFALDKSTLVSTSRDQVAKVWELKTTSPLQSAGLQLCHALQGHGMAVLTVQVINNFIYTSSGDRSVRIWDKRSGGLISKLERVASIAQFQLRKHPANEDHLIAACTDGTIRVYNTKTGTELACLEGHANVVSSVQITEDSSTGAGIVGLISASYDGTVRLWKLPEADLSSGKCVAQLSFTDAVVTPRSLPEPIKANKNAVDPAREKEKERRESLKQATHPVRRVFAMQVSGDRVYCGGESAHVAVWDLQDETNDTL